jgi:hypothetical protein
MVSIFDYGYEDVRSFLSKLSTCFVTILNPLSLFIRAVDYMVGVKSTQIANVVVRSVKLLVIFRLFLHT